MDPCTNEKTRMTYEIVYTYNNDNLRGDHEFDAGMMELNGKEIIEMIKVWYSSMKLSKTMKEN